MTIGQGKRFSETQLARIKQLLADTDMAISDIAARLDCSKSSILSINRRFNIRHYNGRRARWETGFEAGLSCDLSVDEASTNSSSVPLANRDAANLRLDLIPVNNPAPRCRIVEGSDRE